MSYTFTAAFNLYNDSARERAERWALQLEDLSIREIECIFWLITTSYQQLQNAGKFAPTAQMAEAISDVDNIFPYSGTNSGVIDVYNAWENTDTADFVKDLERLGSNGLDGVLYYVALRYMQLLDDRENQKQAASSKFVELAKAVLEHFDISWNTEDVKFVPDNKDVREAPRDPVNFKAADNGIVETEAPETATWNPPYRVYYAYCRDLKRGLRPSSKSMRLFQDKENRAQLYQDELSKLTIRRLEAIIHLAAKAYECRDTDGHVDINKAIKDVRNVFPESGQAQPNARLVNVCNAIDNMVDKPNDNPISMQPFQKGFTALTTNEQEHAFIDMAIAYRKKLREGKRPASMAFVRLADAICKVTGDDGFVDGKDNVHPELKFEEFENEAKTAAVNSENTNRNTDVAENPETNPWRMPEGVYRALMYDPNIDDTGVLNEGEGLNVQAALQRLTVRQLEAVIGLSACAYKSRSGAKNVYGKVETAISNEMLEKAGKLWNLILSAPKGDNERLLHVYNALRSASNAKSLTEDLNSLPLRKVESFLGMAFQVYNDKLRHGAVPADEAFVTMTDEVLELLHMNYDEEEAPAEDEIRHGALDDDNRALVEPIGA